MQLLDHKWSSFCLGDTDYFSIQRGSSEYLKNMIEGDIPYISTTKNNNGICAWVNKANRKENLITLAYDGSIGACFFQDKPFFASEKIVTIDTVKRSLSRSLALFLIQILKLEAQMYSYGGRKWTVEQQLKKTKILLPVNDFGEPDYDFMEEYINRIHIDMSSIPDYFLSDGYSRASWYLDNINQDLFEFEYAGIFNECSINLHDRMWDHFPLKMIIPHIENGKAYNASELVMAVDGTDYISYVTRTDQNNGISKFVEKMDYTGLEKANAITIGDTTSTIFYQDHDFITGPHIIVLRADWMNVYTASFIITLLNQEKYRYPVFGRAFTKDLIAETKLYLPVDDNGDPDYQFMEDYIKSLPFSKKIG